MERGPQRRLVALALDCRDRPAHLGASVMADGKLIGTVTSGAWGHRTGLTLALAFVDPAVPERGSATCVDLIDDMIDARPIPAPVYDPERQRIRP